MAFTNINIGTVPNDGTGDSLRVAGGIINANFAQAALDSAVVHLSGAESIAGVKTFSSIPVGPASDPTTSNQLTRKAYVDGLDAANVKLTGAQSIAGVKTFSSIPVGPASNPTTDNEFTRKKYVDDLFATGGGDMFLASTQTVTGAKTFSDLMLRIDDAQGSGFSVRLRNNETGVTPTAIRSMLFTLNNANRTLNLSGNVIIGGTLTTVSTFSTGDAFSTTGTFTTAGAFSTAGAVTMAAGVGYGVFNSENNVGNADYTFVLSDAWTGVRMAVTTVNRTLTIPTNASVAFPIGTQILVVVTTTQAGIGASVLNITPAVGVTLRGGPQSAGGSAQSQGWVMIFYKVGTNVWWMKPA